MGEDGEGRRKDEGMYKDRRHRSKHGIKEGEIDESKGLKVPNHFSRTVVSKPHVVNLSRRRELVAFRQPAITVTD